MKATQVEMIEEMCANDPRALAQKPESPEISALLKSVRYLTALTP